MIKRIEKLFQTQKQYQLFLLLSLSTLFCFALVGFRWYYVDYNPRQLSSIRLMASHRGIPSFLFLVWNLFLAWVPYWIALLLKKLDRETTPSYIKFALLSSWLVFFPNAPYILTDLLHLKNRYPVPHWYDLMLIASFAWTGLMLGFASLSIVHNYLHRRLRSWQAWLLTVAAIFLCGFGVFLGRFQRWNTWDILTNPSALFDDLANILLHPESFGRTLGLAVVLSVFLLLGYLTLLVLGKNERSEHYETRSVDHRKIY
ncbi:MAG: DUF1361 domain-containing protein [Bacteroidota bacterium]